MKRMNRILALLLVLTLIIPGFTFAESENSTQGETLTRAIEKFKADENAEKIKLEDELGEFFEDEDEVRIIVELKSDPSIVYATERNLRYEEMSKSSIKEIERRIDEEQTQVKKNIESSRVDMKFINSFNTTFNGFSGMVKFGDIKVIESLPQVNKVYISNEYERPEIKPDMDTSKDMIGTLPTWDIGYKGEGTVVAIIDSGIDPSHRDMVLSEGANPKITRETLEGKNLLGKYYTEKVPYGYNYYDLNSEILDLGPDASMHGMHVAGTAGANGDIDNGGIKGVAPECQLLAMKVFSNDPIYSTTFSDIYLVAIDEAIRLGADVLNMSLGSTASFYVPESAEDVAITNATNNGIVCSVSAGNSGSMTYGWTGNSGYPWKQNPDIGVVGAPGLNKDTIQVASIENTHRKVNGLTYIKDDEEHKVPMAIAGNINPATVLSGPQEFVDGGSGHPSELTNVAGKIALVVRGGLTPNFTEKIENAQNAGAVGIIVRNHETGGEDLVNMAIPDSHTIPAVFIGYNGGIALLELENKEVLFTDEIMTIPNINTGKMAESTSWGVTPSLEFKPEITAPGAQIYSTLNDNKYGTMSGTSMAAPHVAGGSALVMEYIKEHEIYGELDLSEQTRLAKVLLMNTAIPALYQYETEYSPRRQGAGIMDLYGAVSTPVRVVDDRTNEAKVELKDFENTEFTMRFKAINDSNTDATYNVDVTVLADYIHPSGLNLLLSDYIYDADIDKPDSVTIPANGEYVFEVTVDIGTDSTVYRNMFVEGFVTLVDPTDEKPTLSVPYVGFYGDWGEPAILDGMRFIDPTGSSYFNASGMLYWDAKDNGYFYTTPHIFMNPGTVAGRERGTGNIMPYLSFMRNAESVNYNILDSEGNLLRTILMQQYKRKNYINGGRNQPVGMITAAQWDGIVNGEVVPDGNYFYEIAAKIHYEGAEVQSKKIPITIDTVGPEISNLLYNPQTNKLTWNSVDKGIGILGFMFNINGQEIEAVVLGEEGKTSYELDMKSYITDAKEYNIEVISVDKLYNTNLAELTFNIDNTHPYIYIYEPKLLEMYTTNDVLFEGYVANFSLLDKVLVNNVEADIEFKDHVDLYHPDDPSTRIYSGPAFKFTKTLAMEDGYQEAKIEAVSKTGASSSLVRRFYVDTTDPELNIDILSIDKESKTAELEITMMDNLGYLELFLGDSQIYVYDYPLVIVEPANETINHTVNLVEGENYFLFTLKDGAGHSTVKSIIVNLESGEGPQEPSIRNIKPSRDVELEAGGTLNISFNAPTGGSAYYRILLPLEVSRSSYGTPMAEESSGLYTATWTAPDGFIASNLAIEVVYIAEDGTEIFEIAEGRVTVKGAMKNMPANSIILGDEAFDMDFLDNDASTQRKLTEWYNAGNPVYIKLGFDTIVDEDGNLVNLDILPNRLIHKDAFGTIRIFEIY